MASSESITGLDVSLGSALLPRPLERHTNRGGGPAISLSPAGATPSYLWVAKAPDADPVVGIVVLYDDEAAPAGYKKIARDLSGGSGGKVYLAYKTGAAADTTLRPLTGIALLKEEEAAGK